MPAKYSHTKKRPPSTPKKNGNVNAQVKKDHRSPNIHVDRSISQAMSAVSTLERAIARILLIRFEHDIARLFSTHLYCVALLHLPTFVMRCITVGGPGWVAANADSDEIKDYFRAVIGMDLRQAGERVATKSVLWSYTALRHFAMSNNVPICTKRGLHSLRLLPHYAALKAHLDSLQAMPAPVFSKPPHLGPLTEGALALEEACESKYSKTSVHGDWDPEWRQKVRVGYERVTQTLWRVGREFDVRGYGQVLREKLTTKWCDCGCSTDHLSEVCEKTVREDEEESGVRPGKEREWDGRGGGVYGWGTEEEEDIWEIDLDFVSLEPEECDHEPYSEMTIGEMMEWRYFKAEREKEQGNVAFKEGNFEAAIQRYKTAHQIEPEMPHYQLNMAAAYLKINKWIDAEKACVAALGQHKSVKGHWRRAQARKTQGRIEDAIQGKTSFHLRAVLKLQPSNVEAAAELASLLPVEPPISSSSSKLRDFPSSSSYRSAGSSSSKQNAQSSSPRNSHMLPKGKQKHQLPFQRTPSDNRKLKISCLPMVIDPKGKKSLLSALKNAHSNTESFTYPSWERYVIRKVSD